jgi:hypothetical protein
VAERPQALPVLFDAIPRELRVLPRWVLWRYAWRDGKWTKVPLTASGGPASTTDPDTWTTFEQARAAYERGGFDGIGLIHVPGDNLSGADWDHVRDPQTGQVEPAAAEEITGLDTYAEASPSGGGVRAYAHGKKPGKRCKKGGFELYDGTTQDGKPGGRFLTVTGHRLPGAPATVNARQGQIDELYRRHFGQEGKAEPRAKARPAAEPEPDANGQHLGPSDDELLAKARAASNGDKFRRLYDQGDITGYPSPSEADAALLAHLAFWTKGDKGRMERLFSASALGKRAKWKRKDYRDLSIAAAVAVVRDGYTSRRPGGQHETNGEEQPEDDAVCVGPLTLRLVGSRLTPTKTVADIDLEVGGQVTGTYQVTSSPGSHRAPAARVCEAGRRAGQPVNLADVLAAFDRLVVLARQRASAPADGPAGPTIREIVTQRVPVLLGVTHKGETNTLWSEVERREVTRTDFVTFWPDDLIAACALAADAPPERPCLIRRVSDELGVLWSSLRASLPLLADADATPVSASEFRRAVVALWNKPGTCQQHRHDKSLDRVVYERLSLAALARDYLRDQRHLYRDHKHLSGGWLRLDKNHAAWVRPYLDGKTVKLLLGMKASLVKGLGTFRGCESPWRFSRAGIKARAFLTDASLQKLGGGSEASPLTRRLGGGKALCVLAPRLVEEILFAPEDDDVTTEEEKPCEKKDEPGDVA